MATERFENLFRRYLADIIQAREERRSHDYRRQLFSTFIHDAFGVEAAEMQLEEHVTALRVRGFIDLLYQYLVFEFKRDLEIERDDAMRELTLYLQAIQHRTPLGVLTDGIRFEVYSLDEGELTLIDEENLEAFADDITSAYLWFEAYLFSARDVVPTPEDIVRRFGGDSAVFLGARRKLREMFRAARADATVQVKYDEWDRLLAKVYGERIEALNSGQRAEDLFIKHTYLVLVARVIAFVATTGRRPRGADVLGIVDGRAFQRVATNLVEADFFAWVLSDDMKGQTRDLLEALVAYLGQYDLSRLGEMDLLQRLYQDLVDPASRHDLGEFYTPDWLAELTLREAGCAPGRSILDPACGSGTFLFTAIRLLSQAGVEPHDLTSWALENIVGVDVHPVAVMTSKVNYVLALQRFGGLSAFPGAISIPVYMADSLSSAEERTGLIKIPVSDRNDFIIEEEMAVEHSLDAVIDTMRQYAERTDTPEEDAAAGFRAWLESHGLGKYVGNWAHNARLMRRLIAEGRDTIWSFILKNAYRPFYLSRRRFDLVVGNPPWLSYRYIRDAGYRAEVRRMVFAYGLLERNEVPLFTQIEIATLFFVHARERYLSAGGTIAFVMPRSVITGARQHRHFREEQPLTKIIDLKDVDIPTETSLKVFGVDSCVLIADASARTEHIPGVRLAGDLLAKGLSYDEAVPHLAREDFVYEPPAKAGPSPYLPRIVQGATIVPHGLWFAAPASEGVNLERPRLMTDPAAMERAQEQWADLHIESEVEADFLYATLLSNDLLPFGSRHYSLVVLPLHQYAHQTHPVLLTSAAAYAAGYPGVGHWLEQAETAWVRGRSRTTRAGLNEWLDYRSKLTDQDSSAMFRVLYNSAGSHVAAAVIDLTAGMPHCYGLDTRGFVAESGTYWIACDSLDECHYLAGALNAPSVGTAIIPHQTRGAFQGGRHLHRRPFEVLPTPIPLYDAESPVHRRLVELSQECHAVMADSETPLRAEIGRLRQNIRASLNPQLREIDVLVSEMLGLPQA